MRGTIVKITKSSSSCFWILGEDNEIYFAHRNELKIPSQWKRYAYKGNGCEFTVVETDKSRNKAVAISLDCILDPFAKEKAEKTKEYQLRHLENVKRKEENLERMKKEKELAEKRVSFYKSHTQYVLQKYNGQAWENETPLFLIDSMKVGREILKLRKQRGVRYRFRKCRIVTIGKEKRVELL